MLLTLLMFGCFEHRHKAKKLQAASERDTQSRMQRLLDAVQRKAADGGRASSSASSASRRGEEDAGASSTDPDARRVARLQRKTNRHDRKATIMKRVKMGKTTIEEGLRMISELDRATVREEPKPDAFAPETGAKKDLQAFKMKKKKKKKKIRLVPEGGGIALDPVTAAFEAASAAAAAAVAAATSAYAGSNNGGSVPHMAGLNEVDNVIEDEVIMLKTACVHTDNRVGAGDADVGDASIASGNADDIGDDAGLGTTTRVDVAPKTARRRGKPTAGTTLRRPPPTTADAAVAAGATTARRGNANANTALPLTTQPDVLTRMDERAKRRQELKDARLERQRAKRIQEEAEHLAEQQRVLDAEAAQRKARIRTRRAKLKEEEEKRLATERHRTEGKRKLELADRHYQRTLMRRYAWDPWTRMLASLKRDSEIAQQHHAAQIAKKALALWRAKASTIVVAKHEKADGHRKVLVLRKCFQAWSKMSEHRRGQNILARRFSDRRLVARVVTRWKQFADAERKRMHILERKAHALHLKHLKRRGFLAFVRFVPESRLEKQRESRRALLRSKVATWLPDYKPPGD